MNTIEQLSLIPQLFQCSEKVSFTKETLPEQFDRLAKDTGLEVSFLAMSKAIVLGRFSRSGCERGWIHIEYYTDRAVMVIEYVNGNHMKVILK